MIWQEPASKHAHRPVRHPSPLVAQRHDELLERIRALTAEHPFWGYRRLWASLRFVEQRAIHKKRILRSLRALHLLVVPTRHLNAKRTPTGRTPHPTTPHEGWGIEMTKILVEGVGWIDLVKEACLWLHE